MLPYMAGKDDVGSYKKTFEISLKEFASKNPAEMAKNSGSLGGYIRLRAGPALPLNIAFEERIDVGRENKFKLRLNAGLGKAGDFYALESR